MSIQNIRRKAYIFLAAFALMVIAAPMSASAQSQEEQIEATTLIKQGDKAPDFTVEMVDGQKIALSSLKGKVVLINFWATWCPPCREEFKRMQKDVVDRFKGKDFQLLAISRGEKKATVDQFRDKQGYTFPMGLDPKQEIYNKYASNYIPRNFVVGKDGKVIYVSVGYEPAEFENMLKAIEAAL
ncbi:MAG: TlpA family protein disulfide reductase [Alistipes sp.]|nr:TlpA family protein disulfide reductase [Rikenellaceae bacterium]MBO4993240.1 TlpA family protein disulfide reductase [Alistipes sp.]MBO5399096.1 TlpA family protein disulfide reductase [Alistipes sp.]MBP3473934.1 TlpA family protein disulfide reductase [Alistipes sp.]MBQ4540477.1 TlpA family protein disulfide reductase [Alistipes sp.]